MLTRPLLAYFAAAYALALLPPWWLYGPTLLGHDTPSGQLWRALAAFPIMVIGVGAAGITLTTITAGQRGRRELWARIAPGRDPDRPADPARRGVNGLRPGLNRYGLAFRLLAGFCEELGWTGYARPRLRPRFRSTLLSG